MENKTTKKFNKIFWLIIIIYFILLNFLPDIIISIKKVNKVETKIEETIMNAKNTELSETINRCFNLTRNGYDNSEMWEIIDAYVNLQNSMAVSIDGKEVVKYAKVKQSYYYVKDDGWIPDGKPDIEVFYK